MPGSRTCPHRSGPGIRWRLGLERMSQRIADPAEASTGGRLMGVEDRVEVRVGEVGVGDDTVDRRSTGVTDSQVVGGGGHELGLPDRQQVFGSVRAIAGPTFDEDGLDDVVTGARVDDQIVDTVRQRATVAARDGDAGRRSHARSRPVSRPPDRASPGYRVPCCERTQGRQRRRRSRMADVRRRPRTRSAPRG